MIDDLSVYPLVGAWPLMGMLEVIVADFGCSNSSSAEVGQSYVSYFDLSLGT